MNGHITWVIDWWVPLDEFTANVEHLIKRAIVEDSVLCLPISVVPGKTWLDLMTLVVSSVDCNACDALCCGKNPHDIPFDLPPIEYKRLSRKYGTRYFYLIEGDRYALRMPCLFLSDKGCSIYKDRPAMCVLYPLQTGATDKEGKTLCLSAACPEACRITRQVYITAWWIRRQLTMLTGEKFKEVYANEVIKA